LLTDSPQDGTTTSKTFVHTPSIIEAEEAEEIGVEHLLRDIRDVAVGTLSTRITSQLQSLQGLHLRLRDIGQYLQKVLDEDLPVNHAILGNLQDVFNLLPNLATPKAAAGGAANGTVAAGAIDNGELARAMSVKTNDQLMAIYLSSLIRAITAFHDLIDNKIQNKQAAEDKEAKKDEGKEGDKDKKEGEAKKDEAKDKAKDEKKT
jgi:26S proteasome regulatory subunit N8